MRNAFCVDVEDWFHILGMPSPYEDLKSWASLPSHVESDTDRLLDLLAEAGARGTFLILGWVAERHPSLVRRIADAGHEIGCHSYAHRLVFRMTPDEFREDLVRALTVLRDVSGQPVTVFRAASFSLTSSALWAYTILREEGVLIDVSIVPAVRDLGGFEGFPRDPTTVETPAGPVRVFPVSVMRLAGRLRPFSGGGYLRALPVGLIRRGFAENHAAGRPCQLYIHPREINPGQPRLPLPRPSPGNLMKYFKYYVGLRTTEGKLRTLLSDYEFTTVSEVLTSYPDPPTAGIEVG